MMSLPFVKIAIAEDHTLVREGVSEYINSLPDCEVIIEATNGRELLNAISSSKSLPDICILDIEMPELNGYDTLIALKKSYAEMKFLVLTMFHSEYSIIRMIKNGANGYLLKNCKPEDLIKAIHEIYSLGYYYSNVASQQIFNVTRHYHLPELSEKERYFLKLCCSELNFSQIGEIMHLSLRTVEDYQKKLGEKLNIHTRTGLVLFAVHSGLFSIDHHDYHH